MNSLRSMCIFLALPACALAQVSLPLSRVESAFGSGAAGPITTGRPSDKPKGGASHHARNCARYLNYAFIEGCSGACPEKQSADFGCTPDRASLAPGHAGGSIESLADGLN